MKAKRTIILDTSAFIAGFDPLSVTSDQYSVPMVENELVVNSLPWTRFKVAVDSGKVKLKKPNKHFLNKVKEASRELGDSHFLSTVDLQVLALALDRKTKGYTPTIVTDDYSIQNVAHKIGLDFTSLVTFGIRFRFRWIRYCPACHRKFSPEYKSKKCDNCGTALKKKPLKKTPLK